MMDDYNEKVIDNFRNPKNMGSMDNPDAEGEVGNPTCGDIMKVFLKIDNNIIKDIKVKTFGCVAAIATSSKMTELALGKTLEEAKDLTRDMVAKELGGLPAQKMHCSNLSVEALHKAIDNYQKKHMTKEHTTD